MSQKKTAIKILRNGGVGILRTDTLYGLVGQAFNPQTVERIYRIKNRDKNKPLIILISELEDLKKFGVKVDTQTKTILKKYWPNSDKRLGKPDKVSIILPLAARGYKLKAISYLHRGKKSLAFRLPAKKSLREIIRQTGPLVAPSANPESKRPAKNVKEAKKYFADKVDFYLDGGETESKPSKLIVVKNGKIAVLRK